MLLLGFLEYLLGLLNLYLAGLHVNNQKGRILGPSGFQEILQRLGLLHLQKSLSELPTQSVKLLLPDDA
jgi:hypothetical protein